MSRSSSQARGRANSPAIPSPTDNGPGPKLPDSYEFYQSSIFSPARGAPARPRPRPPQIEWTANGPENYNGNRKKNTPKPICFRGKGAPHGGGTGVVGATTP